MDGVFVRCPSEADAVENAVNIVLWRNAIEELNESELLGNIVWADAEMLCETEGRDEFGDPNNGAGVGRAEFGDETVGLLWRLERAERR